MLIQSHIANRLLRSLPEDEFEPLAGHLEAVALPRDFTLANEGAEVAFCYFFDDGIGSIVARSPEGHQAEAGIFGRDGYGPVPIIYGLSTSPFDMFVQVPGAGHRVAIHALAAVLKTAPALLLALHRYAYLLGVQTSYTALSNAVHQIDERLARWLLMCHDRCDGDEIALTHEFISLMLAVRRPSVTAALHVLEGNRFISAERGYITIRDREGLEQFAADAYGAPEAEHLRVLGNWR